MPACVNREFQSLFLWMSLTDDAGDAEVTPDHVGFQSLFLWMSLTDLGQSIDPA